MPARSANTGRARRRVNVNVSPSKPGAIVHDTQPAPQRLQCPLRPSRELIARLLRVRAS
jgi:hypothetical protein